MKIIDGPNLFVSKGDIADLLATPTVDLVWKLSHGDQHVVCVPMQGTCFYYLVKSNTDVKAAVSNRGGVMSDFVGELLGYISVDHGDLDTVAEVCLTSSMRGKGYGEGLHRLAYQMSKSGVRSSTDLGTLGLATMIRLYQKEHTIQLIYDGMDVPRDQVQIKGADVWWGKHNLCSPGTGEFWFERYK